MRWSRPELARLTRLAVAAAAALLPVCAQAGGASVHVLPLQSLSPSHRERTLDWRGWSAKASFDLPAGAEADHLRLVIEATPGDAAPVPHAWIEVRLNGSQPAVLRPEPYPFSAQVDFPSQYLRPGRNEAEIRFVSPEGDCPNPADGAWALDLAASRAELTAAPFHPDSPAALDALLRSQFLSPRRIFIAAGDAGPDDEAAFQAWAALAIGVRAPQTPRFVPDPAAADLRLVFMQDETAASASFAFIPGDAASVEVRAPSMEAALAFLRDYAASGASGTGFTIPVLDASWAPEPGEAVFYLAERPGLLPMRAALTTHPEVAAAQMRVMLNGRPVPSISFGRGASKTIFLPPNLLRPGLNRLHLAPEMTPRPAAELCLAHNAGPPARIDALRLDPGRPVAAPGLFGFAAGAFAPGAHVALPAETAAERAAQLRLLAEIARRSGRIPGIAAVSAAVSLEGPATVIVAPRGLIDADLLAAAPVSLHAVLRGDRRPRVRFGSRALADTIPLAVTGAAATFAPPSDPDAAVTLVTQAGDADFAATINHLVDASMLAGFDGHVVRWTRDEVVIQDRGPWRAAPLQLPLPAARTELERTALFLTVLGGLSLSWVMVRGRKRRRFT